MSWHRIVSVESDYFYKQYYFKPENEAMHNLLVLLFKLGIVDLEEDFVNEWEVRIKRK